jgi:hypothetical protein
MGLLLPVLLLGLFPPADQPTSAVNNQSSAQVLATLTASKSTTTNNEPQTGGRSQRPFDRIEPFIDKPAGTSELCLTMRSYYFERQDDLAPEFKGMTTCESARDVRNRNANNGQKPRLVPATSAPAN